MKGKTIKFDLSADKLLDIAEAKLDEEKYLSALRFLHKSIELYGPAADEYADLAEAYEGIEVYEEAIDCWFQFLDLCTEEEAVDAYEGLAACYYNLGNETQAMIYYKKMITDKYFSPENNLELSGMFEKESEPPSRFHVSWPPQKADHSGELGEGLRLLREGQLQKAEELFEKVPESSQYYIAAQNYLAVTCLLEGDTLIIGAKEYSDNDSVELIERKVDSFDPRIGRPLREIDIKKNALVVLIQRDGSEFIPDGDTVLCEGDNLILYSHISS